MDVVKEVKRLVKLSESKEVSSKILERIEEPLNIYKYTYDETEIAGVGYIVARDKCSAKLKVPYVNDPMFTCTLNEVMSLEQLKILLSDRSVEVAFSDMDYDDGLDTFRNLLEE